jgi:uncharacterized protein (DUF952 family)
MIYHIARQRDWQAARATDVYAPPDFAADGFIHCCTAEQIAGVADRYFRGQTDLVLLRIEPARLGADVRWEDLTGSGETYPHIYGPLELAAVDAVTPLP